MQKIEVTFDQAALTLDKGAQAVKDAVTAIRNAMRAGTACTKGKGEVAGSNKKPWKQKGTGNARAGFRQSPVWRGGGVAHGPKPRDFATKLNKKVWSLAFARAFSDKLVAGDVNRKNTNLEVVAIRPDDNAILVKGSVPGARNGIVFVRKSLKNNVIAAKAKKGAK